MANAPIDSNSTKGMLGVSSTDGTTPIPPYVDPTTHRLYVDVVGLTVSLPTADGTATGPKTSSFNSGYSTTTFGDLVYLDSSATWQKADADASATTYSGMLGIALGVVASGVALTVALPGSMIYAAAAFPTFTVGGIVYMSATAGAVTQTAPVTTDSATRIMGYGIGADILFFNPDQTYVIHA